MGEKEITPAGPSAGGGALTNPAPTNPGGSEGGAIVNPKPGGFMGVLDSPETQAGGGATVEKPGTGKPYSMNVGGSSLQSSDLFDDGFRASRESDGTTTLTDPSGTTATWNDDTRTWTGADGNPMPSDWSNGHDPRDYTSKLSN